MFAFPAQPNLMSVTVHLDQFTGWLGGYIIQMRVTSRESFVVTVTFCFVFSHELNSARIISKQ